MRSIACLLSFLCVLPVSIHAQTWTWEQSVGAHPEVFNMRTGSTLVYSAPKEDELSNWQALPFPYEFAGGQVNGYFISDNGYITFDPTAATSYSDNTTGGPRNALFAFWDDFHLEAGNPQWSNEVRSKTAGTAPERVHVIMWMSAVPKGGNYPNNIASFALVLYEQGGFEVVFVAGSGTRSLAGSVGAINADGTVMTLLPGSPSFPYPAVSADPTDDVRYRFHWSSYALDASVATLNVPGVLRAGVPTSIRGTIRNIGSVALTSFDIAYRIDAAPWQIMEVRGVDIATNELYAFTHDVAWTPAEAGRSHTLTVRVERVNGESADERPDNDELSMNVFTILGVTSEKHVLVEEFTGAWCGWCPDGGLQMEELVLTYPSRAVPVAIHAGGVDAMMIPEGDSIATAYNPSYPMAMIDRALLPGESRVPIARNSNAWIVRAGERLQEYTPLQLSTAGAVNSTNGACTVNVNVYFSDFAPPAEYRVHVFLVVNELTGEGRGWDQKNFFSNNPAYPTHPFFSKPDPVVGHIHRHVLRHALTGTWGRADIIPRQPVADAVYEVRLDTVLPVPLDPTAYHVVAFVTRHGEELGQREVLNVVSEGMLMLANANVLSDSRELRVASMFPQPARDMVVLDVAAPSTAALRVSLHDLLGREISLIHHGLVEGGLRQFPINTSGLRVGTYMVCVRHGANVLWEPLSILR